MNKKLYLLIGLFWLIAIRPSYTHATHVAGMDLSVTCMGGHEYLIRLALYRDCSGIAADNTVAFVIQCTSNSSLSFNMTGVPLKVGSGVEVTPNCPTTISRCLGGTIYGVQEYVYEVLVTLPPCHYWRIGWSGNTADLNGLCCRNYSNTVSSPTSQTAYIEATLDNLNAPCLSTPVFSSPLVTILSTGQTQCISLGSIDLDGDSLSYEMVTPMTNGNNGTLHWIPPYSASSPFTSSPPFTFDPITGTLCMSPIHNIISPMAIKVQKWRNINNIPTLIATVYRDVQVQSGIYVNQLPSLSGMDTTMTKGYDPNDTLFVMEVCVGDTVRFALWGYDADLADTTWGDLEKFSITWNNGIPQGDFQTYHNSTDSAYATFNWVPTPADVRNAPHCFTATIRDGACPYNGVQSYGYCIIVQGIWADIGHDTLACQGDMLTFNAVTVPSVPLHYWYVNGVPTGTPLSSTSYTLNTGTLPPGQHVVSFMAGDIISYACPGEDSVVVTVVLTPNPNLGPDTVVYNNNPITLDAGQGVRYLWNTGDTTQVITVNATGLYYVEVDGGHGTRCTGSDSIFIQFIVGMDEAERRTALNIYPNPTTGEIHLELPETPEGKWTLRLFSLEGRLVHTQQIRSGLNGRSARIQIEHLPQGTYLISLSSEQDNLFGKVIKQ